MIRFHVLGAGGAVPTPTHSPAAYLVTVDGQPILLDPGPGALVRHARSGEAPHGVDDLGLVLVSHLHPDHCADLVPLLFALHSPLPARTDPLRLYGPPGLERFLEHQRAWYGSWLEPRRRTLETTEIRPGARLPLDGGGRVEAFAVDHPQDRLAACCLGFVFVDGAGRRAVFSGDTGPCPGLQEAARTADLLVVECSTPDALATPGHLTPGQVGELCRSAVPRRVVLTHQYPPAAAIDLAAVVGRRFAGPVHQAVDGDVFNVPDQPDPTGTAPSAAAPEA